MKITQLEITDFRKGLVALLTAAGEAIDLGLVSGSTAKWIGIAIAAAGFVGVVAVPNTKNGATLKPTIIVPPGMPPGQILLTPIPPSPPTPAPPPVTHPPGA